MAPHVAPVDPRTGLEAARLGVYVHYPYCLSKCPYCDFASTAVKAVPEARYTEAVLAELALRVRGLEGAQVDSIFIGGGTPSLWQPANVARVLDAVARALRVAPRAEVTLEANPGAADASRFAGYRAAGVNRLSMGVQSFEASTLAALGRGHDGSTALRAYETARAAGFEAVSMDFIYGVHGQTLAQVESDARRAASLGSEHLSAYALTLDVPSLAEEVPLAKRLARGEVSLPEDDVVLRMQRAVRDAWAGAGLERYEVSNYARPGYHSRHNALYWTGGEYLAVGAGATGYLCRDGAAARYSNHRGVGRYLADVEAGRAPESSRESLSDVERFEERVSMGLRLTSGVDLEAVCADFGQDWPRRQREVQRLIDGGLACMAGGRVCLTDAGFDVHSAIAARVM